MPAGVIQDTSALRVGGVAIAQASEAGVTVVGSVAPTGNVVLQPGGSVTFAASSNSWSGDNSGLYAFIAGQLRGLFSSIGLSVTGNLVCSGGVDAAGTLKTGGYTVATLPAGAAGMRTYVTDAVSPDWNAALTGGGAVVCPVFYGSAWAAGVAPAAIGVAQSSQNVAATRAVGTTYQNTTARPIEVSINISSSTGSKLEVSADGVAWVVVGSFANPAAANITFNQTAIVPVGHYYRATNTGTINTWAELR